MVKKKITTSTGLKLIKLKAVDRFFVKRLLTVTSDGYFGKENF